MPRKQELPNDRRSDQMPIITNQATLTYNGSTVNSNIVRGEVSAPLTGTKTALSESYAPGDEIAFAVSFVSAGDTALSSLTITDDLGAYAFGTTMLQPLDYVAGSVRLFINGVLQPQPTVSGDSPLTISGVNIPAGANAVILYSAKLNSYAPFAADSSITNSVSVEGDGICLETSAQYELAPSDDALLSIEKSLYPCSLTCNEPLSYTFNIYNRGLGGTVSTDNLVVSDVFDPIIEISSVTLDGAALVEGTDYTYDATTGEFATLPGVITVPAGVYTQDSATGVWSVDPGEAVLVINGTF